MLFLCLENLHEGDGDFAYLQVFFVSTLKILGPRLFRFGSCVDTFRRIAFMCVPLWDWDERINQTAMTVMPSDIPFIV